MITVGIVGCGPWGLNYLRIFQELAGSTVAQVCDQNPDRLASVARRVPAVNATTNLQTLLNNPGIHAIIVATPAATHYRVTRACLLAGKHVLVEKPFAVTAENCQELITLARKNQRVLMVGHTFLYNAGIRKMKECIADRDFGQIYYLNAVRTNLGPIRQDVNAIWDLAPHDVSIFNYLLGSVPRRVSAVGRKVLGNGLEDVGFITLTYAGGLVGHIHVSWVEPNKVRKVVVVGSHKRIVFDDLNALERIKIFERGVSPVEQDVSSFGEFQLLVRDGDIISPKIPAAEPLKKQCAHFLDCIATSQIPMTDGQNGLDVVKTMLAISESIQNEGAPVAVR